MTVTKLKKIDDNNSHREYAINISGEICLWYGGIYMINYSRRRRLSRLNINIIQAVGLTKQRQEKTIWRGIRSKRKKQYNNKVRLEEKKALSAASLPAPKTRLEEEILELRSFVIVFKDLKRKQAQRCRSPVAGVCVRLHHTQLMET
jgi:predicted DNA-binding WGR domain protein